MYIDKQQSLLISGYRVANFQLAAYKHLQNIYTDVYIKVL